ncbi:MAG: pseudouridine synthase [Bacteroidota bacterium]
MKKNSNSGARSDSRNFNKSAPRSDRRGSSAAKDNFSSRPRPERSSSRDGGTGERRTFGKDTEQRSAGRRPFGQDASRSRPRTDASERTGGARTHDNRRFDEAKPAGEHRTPSYSSRENRTGDSRNSESRPRREGDARPERKPYDENRRSFTPRNGDSRNGDATKPYTERAERREEPRVRSRPDRQDTSERRSSDERGPRPERSSYPSRDNYRERRESSSGRTSDSRNSESRPPRDGDSRPERKPYDENRRSFTPRSTDSRNGDSRSSDSRTGDARNSESRPRREGDARPERKPYDENRRSFTPRNGDSRNGDSRSSDSRGENRSKGREFSPERRSPRSDDQTSRRDSPRSEKPKETPTYDFKRYKSDRDSDERRSRKDHEEPLNNTRGIRLNRYIANAGVCSRRDADGLIEAGEIKVNGKIVTEMGHIVQPGDMVKHGNRILSREKLVYVLLNKPKDFITTTNDPDERKTVMDLVKDACDQRIYPVGRLDRNTTGLLLLTNDGELAEKLAHPSNEMKKVYQVELDKPITEEHFEQIKKGLTLEDGPVKVDDLAIVTPDSMVVGIEIHSGRNRIVRRIFEHLGYEVIKLDRTVYAGLSKKELPRGNWRFLTEKEVVKLKYFS